MATHAFRFALGTPECPLSAVWRVWTHDDDAHVAVRTPRGELVFTAYPTGRWRIATGKNVSRWTRPKEFRAGWTRGPDLILPHATGPVAPLGPDPYSAEAIHWLTRPAPDHEARFTLLFASPRAEESHWRPHDAEGTESITMLPLRTMGYLHLSRFDAPVPPGESLPVAVGHPLTHDVIVSADQAGRPSLREAAGG